MVSLCVCQSAPVCALVVPVCCERGLYLKNSSGPSSRGPRSGPFLPGSPPRPRQPHARWHQGARYPSQASRRPPSARSQSAGAAPCGRAASPPSAPFYARGGGEQSARALPAARVPPRLPEVRCASRWADPPPLLLQPGTRQPERGARRLASASPNGTTPRRPPARRQPAALGRLEARARWPPGQRAAPR